MQTSLKLKDTRHIDVGAAVLHCTEISFYPIYNFLPREYCLLNVKSLKMTIYASVISFIALIRISKLFFLEMYLEILR